MNEDLTSLNYFVELNNNIKWFFNAGRWKFMDYCFIINLLRCLFNKINPQRSFGSLFQTRVVELSSIYDQFL